MSAATISAPSRRRSRARRRPTEPRPRIATVRPFIDVVPKARSTLASSAARTPRAVAGEGSPEPPRERARPLTWPVVWAITLMSRDDVPTSSAVMYAPSMAAMASAKSVRTARRARPVGGPSGSMITPLPPPSGRPATAAL
jgi:hypothetical protein